MRYKISDLGDSITCLTCNRTSYNGNDIENRYCGNCHKFMEPPPKTYVAVSADAFREKWNTLTPEQRFKEPGFDHSLGRSIFWPWNGCYYVVPDDMAAMEKFCAETGNDLVDERFSEKKNYYA